MKQRTFLECFIVRPRPVFKISPFLFQSSPKLLEYTTNFKSHEVQKFLTCNQNVLIKWKLRAKLSNLILLEAVFMREVHLSAFDSWQKCEHNTCEETGSQRLS